MAWNNVSDPSAIRQAIAECDRLGETEFLRRYRFGPARTQALVVAGKEYPSKAILGVAHQYQFPHEGALRSADFAGGEHTVKALLTNLGFEVRAPNSSQPSMRGDIERMVREAIREGRELHTSSGGAAFTVFRYTEDALVLSLGEKQSKTPIPWESLEGVRAFLDGNGWVEIGAGRYSSESEAGTLDHYLKTHGVPSRATASWVASVLSEAGVVELDSTPPARVRLAPTAEPNSSPSQRVASWSLAANTSIVRTELHDLFGGTRQGGIAPSAKTKNVLIFSDALAGSEYGYVFDGWQGNAFHYTGEGQVGDQVMQAGNRAIRDHVHEGRSLRVFEGVRGTVRYLGEFQVALDRPFFYAEAPDRDGNARQVVVFRLIPLETVEPTASTAELLSSPAATTVVSETAVEEHQTDSTTVQPGSESWEAVRREQPLVRDYQKYLERRGHEIVRFRARPEGEVTAMVCDLFDKTANVVYEAKGSGTRNAIRMAIGQLADYVRFAPEGAKRAVLLIERPRQDLERLLLREEIVAVWRNEAGGFSDNSSGDPL